MTERYSIVRTPACLAALASGQSKFTADAPCFRGHAPIRYTNNGACVECAKLRAKGATPPRRGLAAPLPQAPASGTLTLQLEVPALDVHCLRVCAALLGHPAVGRQVRVFLARNAGEVRGDLPGAILKRI
jgi:hypothetical protein